MTKLNDLTGKTFGRLTVISRDDDYVQPSGRRRTRWLCKCQCGNTVSVLTDALLRGKTQSCGCFRKELMSDIKSTHKESNTHLYGIWRSIKSRCLNPNANHYNDYGGRGITICEEWKEDFICFKKWAVSNGYRHGLTIDRINNDGNYDPDNCRWTNMLIQANNRRSNKLYTYNGETHNIKEWSEIRHIPYKTLHNRLHTGWSIEKALNY